MMANVFTSGNRAGANNWSLPSLGRNATGMGTQGLASSASEQGSGSLLAGGMQKLLTAHVNTRIGTISPTTTLARTQSIVDRITLSAGAVTQIGGSAAVTATSTAVTSKAVSTVPVSATPSTSVSGLASVEDYRALGRANESSRIGRGSVSAFQREQATTSSSTMPTPVQNSTGPSAGSTGTSAATTPAAPSSTTPAPEPPAQPPQPAYIPPSEPAPPPQPAPPSAPTSSNTATPPASSTSTSAGSTTSSAPPATSGTSTSASSTPSTTAAPTSSTSTSTNSTTSSGSSGGLLGLLFGRR